MIRTALALGFVTALSCSCALAAPRSAPPKITAAKLMDATENIIGQKIAYPNGSPEIQSEIIVIPPGQATEWHTHAVPMYAYLFEGELSIDYGEQGIKTLKKGEAMLEAQNWPHRGKNISKSAAKVLVVYMGAVGVPVEAASAPKAPGQ